MAISSAPHRGGHPVHHNQLTIIVAAFAAGLIVAAVTAALLARGGGQAGSAVQGSGVAAMQLRTVVPFSGLDLAGSNSVTVAVGARQSVVVHADSNLISHVTTQVVNGTLVIGDTGSFSARTPMNVVVSVPSLTALNLSGDGQISVSGIKVPQLTVTISGSGLLYVTGTAGRLDVTVSGDGDAQLARLTARDVHAVVSGSGAIQVTATTALDAAVPGTGAIVYGGNPSQVTTNVTGTGAITRG
jgi:hypothetical protein